MINYDYPTLFLSSVLICDTVSIVGGINVGPDTIQPELTKVGGIPISAALEIRSDFGGVRLPKLTQAAINNMIMDDGMIFYNADNPSVQFQINGNTETFTQGDGDVAGPGISVDGNLPAFDGTDGKLLQDSGILMTEVVVSNDVGSSNANNIAVFVNDTGLLIGDSGVAINQVPALTGLNTANVNVNQLSEIGIINFETPDISVLGASLAITGTVPALGFRFANIFMTNTDNKASIVFSNNPSALPSSEDASIEIQSDEQAILVSRMTTANLNSMVTRGTARNGMIAYDEDLDLFKFRENGIWTNYSESPGDQKLNVTVVPSSPLTYQVIDTDCVVLFDDTVSARSIVLPLISDNNEGQVFIIKKTTKITSSVSILSPFAGSGQTIDGVSIIGLTGNELCSITVVSDGISNWSITNYYDGNRTP